MSFFVRNIITIIGLAVGIDYSLFVVSRYREERGRGTDKIDSISRAVIFSGTTVVLALVGMLLIPFNIIISVGIGAILGIMGDRVNSLGVPFIGKGKVNFE